MKSCQAILAALLLAAIPAFAQNVNINQRENPQTCADLNVSIGWGETVRAEQAISFPASEAPTLSFDNQSHAGIHVTGWDQNEYSVTVCKAAGAGNEAESKALLDRIQLQRNGGSLTLTGPDQNDDNHRWMAILLVKAPRNAVLNLRVKNGPMSLSGMNGSGTLEAKNGPISVRDSAGKFEINTQNGPISISGRGGNLKLTAQNGPIDVNVNGDSWNGELSGEAHNGPIQLRIPRKFSSGVEVTNTRGPMSCSADACEGNSASSEDGDHHLRLGSGNTVIRLSTQNGPVMVSNRKTL